MRSNLHLTIPNHATPHLSGNDPTPNNEKPGSTRLRGRDATVRSGQVLWVGFPEPSFLIERERVNIRRVDLVMSDHKKTDVAFPYTEIVPHQ